MGHADRASFAGTNMSNWADDHVEGDLYSTPVYAQAMAQASNAEDFEGVGNEECGDEEWFEDDLASLIQNRPSRHARHSPAGR